MYVAGFGAHGFDVEDETTDLDTGRLGGLHRDLVARCECSLGELILAQEEYGGNYGTLIERVDVGRAYPRVEYRLRRNVHALNYVPRIENVP